jgi:hypothetical protein
MQVSTVPGMPDSVDLVRSDFTSRTADEMLRAPVTALLGVSAAAAAALQPIGIVSVFDLAASRVFAAARRLAVVADDSDHGEPESKLGAVASDVVEMPAGVAVADLARQPLAILRGIGGANAPALTAALDVTTVRDLSLWPPSLAARALLADAFFPDQAADFDPEAPRDLLPRSGVYPTERVFYRTLMIDGPVTDAANALPIERLDDAIDILPGLLAPTGFQQVMTGALLTFSQSWFSQGLTLGQLLHSTALAPGESTRLAVVDWSRRSSASTDEDVSESERLSNTQTHNRALSEVTQATATEFQSGQSSSTATSETSQTGAGLGLEIGPLAFGGSHGSSTTTTDVVASSSSFGVRDQAANYAQSINDRTQQNASSSRSRRASIVREVSQQEHESISTRVLTNYNHMHALSVHYYEVVQAFRVTTQLDRAERCLFLPVALMDFSDLARVERWRAELAQAALSPAIARALAELGTVRVVSKTRRVLPLFKAAAVNLAVMATAAATAATDDDKKDDPPAPPPAAQPYIAPSSSRITRLAQAGWQLDQIERLGRLTGRLLIPTRTNTVYLSDDALLVGVSLRSGRAARFSLLRQDGIQIATTDASATGVTLAAPLAIPQLLSISLQHAATTALSTQLTLQLSLHGTLTTLDVPVELAPGGLESGLQELVRIELPTSTRDLVDHLQANRLHYTQAVLRRMDGPAIASILARFTWRGLPLAQLVDQRPVAITSNLMAFRMNMPEEGAAPDERLAADLAAWREFLARTGLSPAAPRSEIVPLPSGGVFAEAVLGRFNSAERLDMQRFWNWQDSPIPIVASEISPVEAGTRSLPEDLTPGQLSSPVVSIQNPVALPDPTSIAAVVTALQNSGFRDMSGLAQNAAIALAAQQASAAGATAVAKQAAQNMQTVMEQQTERLRIAAQVAATMMGIPTAGAGGGGSGSSDKAAGKNSTTERGGELRRAAEIDAKQAAAPGTTSEEAETFRTQTGIKGRKLAGAVLEAAGIPPDVLPPVSQATRTVGPTLPAPRSIAFRLQLSSYFTDGTVFTPGSVTIDASLVDPGGKRLWSHSGPPAASFTASLRTTDTQLSMSLTYTYSLTWPQASTASGKTAITVDVPNGTTNLETAVFIVGGPETANIPAGTDVSTPAALAQALRAKGYDLTKVMAAPTVTAQPDGSTNVAFRLLRAVALQQLH